MDKGRGAGEKKRKEHARELQIREREHGHGQRLRARIQFPSTILRRSQSVVVRATVSSTSRRRQAESPVGMRIAFVNGRRVSSPDPLRTDLSSLLRPDHTLRSHRVADRQLRRDEAYDFALSREIETDGQRLSLSGRLSVVEESALTQRPAEDLPQEISTRLNIDVANKQLLTECVNTCKNYAISAEDLQYKWEAHNFKSSATRSEIPPYTLKSLLQLKCELQQELASKFHLQREKPRTSLASSINVSHFRTRNPEAAPVPSIISVKGPSNNVDVQDRYMYETPLDRGNVLDARIDEFAKLIREHYKRNDLGDPSSPTTESITVVGRIIHDDEAAEESKLTDGTIALECSRTLGRGARVPLQFDSNLKIHGGPKGSGSVAFFPGAVAALQGRNGGGGYFQVSEILTLPPLMPFEPSVQSEADNGTSAFSMFIVSGPYTPDQDLGFKPWRAILNKIKEAKPAAVLLLGPFIDALHPLIKSGHVDSTPLNLFRTRFTDPLRAYLDSAPGSIALIVPSVRDLVSDHAVFPQCELPSSFTRGDPRIHLLPNPASFTLNGISFAATSVDVLAHMKKGELLKSGEAVNPMPAMSHEDTGGDPMANVCRHLLQQRSFYPVFPVPHEFAAEVNLDVTHSAGLRLGSGGDMTNGAPDVLILPSRFKQFTKTVYATAAFNPSFLTKASYVVVDVAARNVDGAPAQLSPRIVKLE
ncbi:DNA polymerase alpha/epsilon subunit B-domain-containing protein [Mycena crocata]|nr:DNA polymerase alpha/epsilon subunit B-domain-containing protein [Mycena crocata]